MNTIILLIGIIILGVSIALKFGKKKMFPAYKAESEAKVKKVSKLTTVGIIVSIVVILASSCFVIIPTGYTGVKTTFGQIDEKPLPNGFNLKIPFIQSVQKVNNKQQDNTTDTELKVWGETNNRTAVYFENIVVSYTINPEYSAWICAHVSDYKSNLITDSLLSSSIKSASKTLTDVDVTDRSIIERLVAEQLQKSLDEKYSENAVIVNKVVINNIDFEDSYNQAIAAKQTAQLAYEKQQVENKTAIEKAQADAEVTKTKAQATADAAIIKAEGEAKANKKIEDSLSNKVIENKKVDKWNGELPQVVSDANALIDITGAK